MTSCKCVLRFLTLRGIECALAFLIILHIPYLPPYCSFEDTHKVTPARPLVGSLALNNKLANAQLWHHENLHGPESFAVLNNEVYTSLIQGDVVKLTGQNHITHVAKLGSPCRYEFEERICGRPLGLEFDKNGDLFVVDAYYGLFKINIQNGEKTRLVSPDEEIEGKKPKVFNHLAVASNGDIYWSDSSTTFNLENGLFDFLADGSGRLIKYDAKTKTNKVLIDNLQFANGVALSDDENYVIVSETGRNRLLRYNIKAQKTEVFIDGLPGMPDNIRPDGQGGFLVPLIVSNDPNFPNIFHVVRPFPKLRKVIARILNLLELNFQLMDSVYPNNFAKMAMHFVGHFTSANALVNGTRVTVLRVRADGEIVDSLHDTTGKLMGISEALIYKKDLLLGSPYNRYIARIPLAEVGWTDLIQETKSKPVQTAKTSQPPTTPKPTQAPTTPKPTQAPTTPKPVQTPKPTQAPTTPKPVQTPKPTQTPTKQVPTAKPTQAPTTPKPVQTPKPTQAPTKPVPTAKPTQAPTTHKPVQTAKPTQVPTTPKPVQAARSTPLPTTPKPVQAVKPSQVPTTSKPVQAAKPSQVPTTPKPVAKASQVPKRNEL